METNLQLVTLHDRATITNSKIVAEVFGKSHDDVLRAIRDLKNDVATGGGRGTSPQFCGDVPRTTPQVREDGCAARSWWGGDAVRGRAAILHDIRVRGVTLQTPKY